MELSAAATPGARHVGAPRVINPIEYAVARLPEVRGRASAACSAVYGNQLLYCARRSKRMRVSYLHGRLAIMTQIAELHRSLGTPFVASGDIAAAQLVRSRRRAGGCRLALMRSPGLQLRHLNTLNSQGRWADHETERSHKFTTSFVARAPLSQNIVPPLPRHLRRRAGSHNSFSHKRRTNAKRARIDPEVRLRAAHLSVPLWRYSEDPF